MNNQLHLNNSVNSIVKILESFQSASADKTSKIDYNEYEEVFHNSVRSYAEAAFGDYSSSLLKGLNSLEKKIVILKENLPKQLSTSEIEFLQDSVKKIKHLFSHVLNLDLYPFTRADKITIQNKIDVLKNTFFNSMVAISYELQAQLPSTSSIYQAFEVLIALQSLLKLTSDESNEFNTTESTELTSSLLKDFDSLTTKLLILDILKDQRLSFSGAEMLRNLMIRIENLIPNLYDLDLTSYNEADQKIIEERIDFLIETFLMVKEGIYNGFGIQLPPIDLPPTFHPTQEETVKLFTEEQQKRIKFKNEQETSRTFTNKFIESLHDEEWKKQFTELFKN